MILIMVESFSPAYWDERSHEKQLLFVPIAMILIIMKSFSYFCLWFLHNYGVFMQTFVFFTFCLSIGLWFHCLPIDLTMFVKLFFNNYCEGSTCVSYNLTHKTTIYVVRNRSCYQTCYVDNQVVCYSPVTKQTYNNNNNNPKKKKLPNIIS